MVFNSTEIKYSEIKNYSEEDTLGITGTNFNLNKFIYFNLFISVILILLGLIAGLISLEQGSQLTSDRLLYRFVKLFNLNLEANIPAWYSGFLMIMISGLSLYIAKIKSLPLRKYFLSISIIFLFMSIDEISSIHEILNNPVRTLFNFGSLFYWAWIFPALVFLIILAFAFRQFFMMIDKKFGKLFLLSGVVYLMGVIGFEMLGGWLYSNKLGNSYYYVIEVVVEESLEMVGLWLFIYALIEYLKSFVDEVRIGIQ
ncbi:MAG: hypothetical protein HZC46_03255 [Ignavibacterium album]|uniref:hypothetical protein n=1 Tax=Ignavibacterium album TaxID=591197 RepID=UPI0026EA7C8B|nr:hypothetical protein [Ignavibacterium album]MBI5661144.1 hypothetical protein [Ignavibacterium album]